MSGLVTLVFVSNKCRGLKNCKSREDAREVRGVRVPSAHKTELDGFTYLLTLIDPVSN